MEIVTTNCLLTGCSILVRDPHRVALIHGDMYFTRNNFTGGHFMYLGGVGRAKDGKMHCTVFEADALDIPDADAQVIGGVVGMVLSDTGYGQFTFAQRTMFLGQRIIDNLDRYFPESKKRILEMYEKEVIGIN